MLRVEVLIQRRLAHADLASERVQRHAGDPVLSSEVPRRRHDRRHLRLSALCDLARHPHPLSLIGTLPISDRKSRTSLEVRPADPRRWQRLARHCSSGGCCCSRDASRGSRRSSNQTCRAPSSRRYANSLDVSAKTEVRAENPRFSLRGGRQLRNSFRHLPSTREPPSVATLGGPPRLRRGRPGKGANPPGRAGKKRAMATTHEIEPGRLIDLSRE